MCVCLHNRKEVLSRTIPWLYTKNKLNFRDGFFVSLSLYMAVKKVLRDYFFFLCLFFLSLFLRLCTDILCLFLFFPLGIFISPYLFKLFSFLYLSYKRFGRLKSRDIVFGNDDRGIF